MRYVRAALPILVTMMLAAAAPAQAAMLVLGGGMAEDCYKAALHEASDGPSLELCTRALSDEPLTPKDRASTFINRGVILISRRAYEAAAADFDSALRIKPGMAEAYVNRGAARLGQKRYAEALSDLDRGLELGAKEPQKAWYDKGLAHEGLGDVKAAYFDYRKASDLKPDWEAPKKELQRFTVTEK
jgi:tetratricopeptide (TPR) repeat protein